MNSLSYWISNWIKVTFHLVLTEEESLPHLWIDGAGPIISKTYIFVFVTVLNLSAHSKCFWSNSIQFECIKIFWTHSNSFSWINIFLNQFKYFWCFQIFGTHQHDFKRLKNLLNEIKATLNEIKIVLKGSNLSKIKTILNAFK